MIQNAFELNFSGACGVGSGNKLSGGAKFFNEEIDFFGVARTRKPGAGRTQSRVRRWTCRRTCRRICCGLSCRVVLGKGSRREKSGRDQEAT